MKTYNFEIAGNRIGEMFNTLYARNRTKKALTTVFHRNDFHTVIKVPKDDFLAMFRYDRFRNAWIADFGKYYNLDKYMTIFDLR